MSGRNELDDEFTRLSTPLGPYDTEDKAYEDARASWYDRDRAVNRPAGGNPMDAARGQAYEALLNECASAGIELGKYDRAVLVWLADMEIGTAQVVLGLLRRARLAGENI